MVPQEEILREGVGGACARMGHCSSARLPGTRVVEISNNTSRPKASATLAQAEERMLTARPRACTNQSSRCLSNTSNRHGAVHVLRVQAALPFLRQRGRRRKGGLPSSLAAAVRLHPPAHLLLQENRPRWEPDHLHAHRPRLSHVRRAVRGRSHRAGRMGRTNRPTAPPSVLKAPAGKSRTTKHSNADGEFGRHLSSYIPIESWLGTPP